MKVAEANIIVKKCVEKHTIHYLPYTICEPGEYCLARDFHWDEEIHAITVTNTENVVLNFNQRKITSSKPTNTDGDQPIVLVRESKDVQVNDAHNVC